MDCLFCKIGSGDIESLTVYEDGDVRALLDIQPLTPGHAIVIPKAHYSNIIELPDTLIAPVFSAVKKVTQLLAGKLGVQGFTIGINHGTIAHQEINHLHIHIIPRYEGDGGGNIHSVVRYAPGESVEDVYKRITGGS